MSLMACIGAEVVAAAFIIIGLATRPAAFMLGFTHGGRRFRRARWRARGSQATRRSSMPRNSRCMYLIPMIAIILIGCRRLLARRRHLQGTQTPPLVKPWKRTVSSFPAT